MKSYANDQMNHHNSHEGVHEGGSGRGHLFDVLHVGGQVGPLGHKARLPEPEVYELKSMSRVGSICRLLASDWLFTLVEPIRSQLALVDPCLDNDYNS